MTAAASTSSSASGPSQPPLLFTVAPVPSGLYLGAISTQLIPSGTVVLSETPLFTLDAPLQSFLFQRTIAAGPGSGPTPVEGEEDEGELIERWKAENGREFEVEDWMERVIVAQLSGKTDQERAEFWDLAKTRDDLKDTPGWNIFTTNAVSTTRDVGGAFLLLSRFNSSCRPNLTRPIWDSSTRKIVLKALHDIPPGTELVWPYLAASYEFDSIGSRSGQLEHVFGFACACEGCALVGEGREKSEDRCRQLRFLRDARGGEKGENVGVVRRMEELAREEGLWEAAERLQRRVEELERAQ